MFKKMLLTAALIASGYAHASNIADGIYKCQSKTLPETYVTVISNSNNQTLFVVAALSQITTGLYGFGIGSVTTTNGVNTFSGSTMMTTPFSFDVNTEAGSLSGTVSMLIGKSTVAIDANCNKIF